MMLYPSPAAIKDLFWSSAIVYTNIFVIMDLMSDNYGPLLQSIYQCTNKCELWIYYNNDVTTVSVHTQKHILQLKHIS